MTPHCAYMWIYNREREIEWHFSFDTDSVHMKNKLMNQDGTEQYEIASLQHYLRWSTQETASYSGAIGIAYATTLGSAVHAEFRSGNGHQPQKSCIENNKYSSSKRAIYYDLGYYLEC